jgi:pyruvate dehydrogenase E2 component (dihydrolipoamide acetyltransferase)
VAEVGAVLVTLETGEAEADAPDPEEAVPPPGEPPAESPAPPQAAPKQAAPTQAAPPAAGGKVLATPATRKLARELGIDITSLSGSGPGGRIEREDVVAASEGGAPPADAPATPAAAQGPAAQGDEVVPFRGIRGKIAEHMLVSKRQAAHFTYVDEVDCTRLVKLHTGVKPMAEERGVRITYLALILRAVARALREHPKLNSSALEDGSGYIVRAEKNFGIAVDTPQGLLVPVVKGVDQRTLFDLSAEVTRLAGDAREGRARLEDLQGSTFTVTSIGNIGGLFATPILNYPEVAILGVNKIHPRPVVRDGAMVVRDMCYLSLTLDHRVVDGADGARFMNTLKDLLEEPALLLLEE